MRRGLMLGSWRAVENSRHWSWYDSEATTRRGR